MRVMTKSTGGFSMFRRQPDLNTEGGKASRVASFRRRVRAVEHVDEGRRLLLDCYKVGCLLP